MLRRPKTLPNDVQKVLFSLTFTNMLFPMRIYFKKFHKIIFLSSTFSCFNFNLVKKFSNQIEWGF